MKLGRILLSTSALILSATIASAQQPKDTAPAGKPPAEPERIKTPPAETAPAMAGPAATPATALPAPDATVTAPPRCACSGEIMNLQPPCGGSVGCIARRHKLWDWLTYVPSRRPCIDGNICNRKQPNIQPPLYDFFPGEQFCCGANAHCNSNVIYRYPQAKWVNPLLGRPGAGWPTNPPTATNVPGSNPGDRFPETSVPYTPSPRAAEAMKQY